MEGNSSSIFKTNVTLDQVMDFFNLTLANVTNESEVSQIHLFDLYEAYKTREKEQLLTYKWVAYILGILIILSNLTVVISSGLILKKGQQPKSTYLLLGNVSLADTIIGISIIFGASVDNSMSSNQLCIFQLGMLVCPAMVSIFSVGLIAIDRYIYILHGLYYQRWFNTTRVRIGIVCIWIIGIFIACLPAMGWTGQTFRDFRCFYIAVFPPSLLIVVSVLVLSVIITVCLLYLLILHSAVKAVDKIREFKESNIAYVNKAFEDSKSDEMSKTTVTITVSTETVINKESLEMHELTKTNIEEKQVGNAFKQRIQKMSRYYCKSKSLKSTPTKLKAVKTVLLVTFCFVGTWAPYYVAIIMYVKCDIMIHGYDCIPLEILTLGPLYLLGASNSLCDPLIYAWRHSGFKRTLRKIYWKYVLKIKT
ncbi:5-hydroxytryptamine receptor 1F-like isoform X2 [Ostrinia nubilalis]|uniref:5-hydroxytryptamine receptor 1F-like isoform X2 n=1 Tax=Ostrinia nubilalis TaxID=29057 RepID=UPI0030825564